MQKKIQQLKQEGSKTRDKKALVLAGGGLAGIAYELGALHALDQLLVDFTVNDFDMYAGTSAGATLSALLANGLSPGMILQAIDDNHEKTRPFLRADLWHFSIGRFFSAGIPIPGRLWHTGYRYLMDLRDTSLFGSLWVLRTSLHAGLQDQIKRLVTIYPDVTFYLIEPPHDDNIMSAPNLLRYRDRSKIAERAYKTVSQQLARDHTQWKAIWQRHDMVVRLLYHKAGTDWPRKVWPPPQPIGDWFPPND